MYEYRPSRQNAAGKLTALALFVLSLAGLFGSTAMPNAALTTLLQCVGLALLLPAVQILARYVVTRYLYRIEPYEDGNTDLSIYAYRGGAKMQLVCRIGLEEITAAVPLSGDNKKAAGGLKRYNYHPDLVPVTGTVLSITNADGDCELLFSPDERILQIIKSFTPPAALPVKDPAASSETE